VAEADDDRNLRRRDRRHCRAVSCSRSRASAERRRQKASKQKKTAALSKRGAFCCSLDYVIPLDALRFEVRTLAGKGRGKYARRAGSHRVSRRVAFRLRPEQNYFGVMRAFRPAYRAYDDGAPNRH
jgi:hypothetical protein